MTSLGKILKDKNTTLHHKQINDKIFQTLSVRIVITTLLHFSSHGGRKALAD